MAKHAKTKIDKLVEKLKAVKAKDIMTEDVISTTENTTLADVAKIMVQKRISGMPVMNKKKKVTGVITATDLFVVMDMIEKAEVAENGKTGGFNPTVKFAMSEGVPKIKKSTDLNEIIRMMKYRNLHTIPVFQGNKLVGVIGRRDIYRKFYSALKELS